MELSQKVRVDGKNMLFHNENRGSYHGSKSTEKKHHKIQGALRGCGNWSEHISSSGKKYFYNNLSEVSQWEKPKDWNESDVVDLKSKDKNKFSSSHKNSSSKSHHSSHRPSQQSSSDKPHQSHNSNDPTDKDYRSNNFDRDYRSSKSSSNDRDYRDIDYRDKLRDVNKGKDKDYRSGAANPKTFNHTAASNSLSSNVRWEGKKGDIVNGKHSSDYSSHSSNRSKAVLPENIEESSEKSNSESTASMLVRTLSNVLNQASTNTTNNNAEGNLKNALQLLIKAAAKNQEARNEEAENSSPPAKKTCHDSERAEPEKQQERSPEPKFTVPDFVHLDYLRPVFEPAFVSHIQNWPSDICEKQCHQFATDYHKFMSEHLTCVNAELTTTRSKVRTSEILSTVKEQRILNIRQQIKDLDKISNLAGSLT